MSKKDLDLIYQLDGRPNLRIAAPLGLQHVLAMFVGNLAPVMILAGIAFPNNSDAMRIMIQAALFTSGVFTLIQVYPIKIGKVQIGTGLPIVMGIAFSVVAVGPAIIIEYGYGAFVGAAMVGALLQLAAAYVYKYIKIIFNPLVVGTLLITLGITLIGVGADYFVGGYKFDPALGYAAINPAWQDLLLAIVTLLVVLGFKIFGKGTYKTLGILVGIVVGTILAYFLGLVDFSAMSTVNYVSFGHLQPFALAKPVFILAPIVAFLGIYFAAITETVADINGITMGGLNRQASQKEIESGLLVDSIGSIVATCFNGMTNCSFGQNVGIVATTKVVNKFVVAIGGGILIALSFLPKFAQLFSLIPAAVLGGALITIFASILGSGVKMLMSAGSSENNIFIATVALALGLGLGGNIHFETILNVSGLGWLWAIFSTGYTTAALTAIIMSLIVKPDYSKGTYDPDLI